MTIKVYISQDTTAVAVGAERVATAFVQAALNAELSYTLVRNGSRGAFGLEPWSRSKWVRKGDWLLVLSLWLMFLHSLLRLPTVSTSVIQITWAR